MLHYRLQHGDMACLTYQRTDTFWLRCQSRSSAQGLATASLQVCFTGFATTPSPSGGPSLRKYDEVLQRRILPAARCIKKSHRSQDSEGIVGSFAKSCRKETQMVIYPVGEILMDRPEAVLASTCAENYMLSSIASTPTRIDSEE